MSYHRSMGNLCDNPSITCTTEGGGGEIEMPPDYVGKGANAATSPTTTSTTAPADSASGFAQGFISAVKQAFNLGGATGTAAASSGVNTSSLLLLGAVGFGAYYLLRKKKKG